MHPSIFEIVTEKSPAVLTVMQFVVSPVLHKKEEAPVDTQSSVDSPWQIERSPIIKQPKAGFTMRKALQLQEHPSTDVMVTEYTPMMLTVIQFVVSPVLHK
jgi:hypothetical protein